MPEAHAILAVLAQLVTDREHEAHEALQVGGYLPLDPDFPVEIPLSLCYAARKALAEAATSTSQEINDLDRQKRG